MIPFRGRSMYSVRPSRFRPRCELLEERAIPAAGQLDPTFGNGGFITTNVRFQPAAEIDLPDGKYLAAGTTESLYLTDFAVARFNADGSLDTTFGKSGYSGLDFDNSSDYVTDVVRQADGKILVVGSSEKSIDNVFKQEFAAARFNADGSLDTTFGSGGKVVLDLDPGINDSGQVQTAVLQNDGKIVLVGITASSPGSNHVTLARLNTDGAMDTTFGTAGIARPDLPYSYNLTVHALADGRILITGSPLSGSGDDGSIALVRADGTLDPTFGTGGRAPLTGINPHAIAVQADGKILVTGNWYTGSPGGFDFVVMRLNANGSTDAGFGTGGRVATDFQQNSDTPYAIAVQANGKILVGGATASFYPVIDPPIEVAASPSALVVPQRNQMALARYNPDGTLDTGFGVAGRAVVQTGIGANINHLALQADGKIVAVGPTQQISYPYFGFSYLNGGLAFARFDGTGAHTRYVATGSGPGGGPHVKVYDAVTGQLKFSFYGYAAGFSGGVRVAIGDVTGDGVDDIVTGAGAGGTAHVRVFDGTDGHLVREFIAYAPAFSGGVYVAVGDVNGDGKDDIITGAGEGGGPHVKVFDGATGSLLDEFMAYNGGFTGGVRVAAGDVNGDGLADLITGAGPGGGPHVKVFDGRFPPPNVYIASQRTEIFSTMAFAASYTGGVFVGAGDLDGDGKAEVIVGQGHTLSAKVRVIRASDAQVLAETTPFADTPFVDGIRVTTIDRTNDGRAEVIVGTGPGSTKVRFLKGLALAQDSEFTAYDPGFPGGVFVG